MVLLIHSSILPTSIKNYYDKDLFSSDVTNNLNQAMKNTDSLESFFNLNTKSTNQKIMITLNQSIDQRNTKFNQDALITNYSFGLYGVLFKVT
jgi:hypothetical protein